MQVVDFFLWNLHQQIIQVIYHGTARSTTYTIKIIYLCPNVNDLWIICGYLPWLDIYGIIYLLSIYILYLTLVIDNAMDRSATVNHDHL